MQNLSDIVYLNPDSPSGLSWKVERRMGKGAGYVYAKPGDSVGSFDGKYYVVSIDGVRYKVHRLVYQLSIGELLDKDLVDHIDRNTKNNAPNNLRKVEHKVNCRNKTMQVTNSSGHTGIHFDTKRDYTYAVVTWYELDGRKLTKSFNCSKLGLLEGFNLAVGFRKQTIEKLNINNAGYTATHGR